MTTTQPPQPTRPGGATAAPVDGRDRGTYGGMLAVAVAAAVLSFSALAGLAELAGVSGAVPLPAGGGFRLAWLLPIAVDAYAVTATRVWLRTAGTVRTRRYARRNAIGAIALSVAGNAAYHALTAAGVTSLADVRAGWVVVVAVSAVPPVMLGLVGHLHALVSEDHRPTPAASPAAGPVAEGRTLVDSLAAARAAERAALRPPAGPTGATRAAGTGPRTGRAGGTRTGTRPSARTGTRTDAELTAVLVGLPREPDGTVPIRRATAAAGCGPDRARKLLAATGLLRTPTGAPAGTPEALDPAAGPVPGTTPSTPATTPSTPETADPADAPARLAA